MFDLEGVPVVSIESMAIALHHSRAKGTTKLILVGIANHDGDGGAMPSMRTLAKYGGCDIRTARKHVARLEGFGEIRRDIQGATLPYLEDDEQPNRYEFLLICPAWCDRSAQHRDTRRAGTRARQLVLPGTPRSETTPRSELPGGPRSETTAKPSPEPDTTRAGASTTGQARADGRRYPAGADRPCVGCGLTYDRHAAAITRGTYDRHPFEPEPKRSRRYLEDDPGHDPGHVVDTATGEIRPAS